MIHVRSGCHPWGLFAKSLKMTVECKSIQASCVRRPVMISRSVCGDESCGLSASMTLTKCLLRSAQLMERVTQSCMSTFHGKCTHSRVAEMLHSKPKSRSMLFNTSSYEQRSSADTSELSINFVPRQQPYYRADDLASRKRRLKTITTPPARNGRKASLRGTEVDIVSSCRRVRFPF